MLDALHLNQILSALLRFAVSISRCKRLTRFVELRILMLHHDKLVRLTYLLIENVDDSRGNRPSTAITYRLFLLLYVVHLYLDRRVSFRQIILRLVIA